MADPRVLSRIRPSISHPSVKPLLEILGQVAFFAIRGGSGGVLPAPLAGMVLADMIRSGPGSPGWGPWYGACGCRSA